MNLIEIKNASRIELIEYVEAYGIEVNYSYSMKSLRDLARDCYWNNNSSNQGYSFETVQGF